MRIGKIAAAVVLIAALSIAGVAAADGSLAVAFRGGNTATYPNPVKLVVTAPETKAESITVDVRYAGGDWKTFRTISASRAAESTRYPVTLNRPTANFEVRAVQGALESAVATGGVKARLSAIALRRSAREDTTVTVKGSIAPTHAVDAAAVTVKVYKLSTHLSVQGRGHGRGRAKVTVTRELVAEYPGVVYKNSHGVSWWKASLTVADKGVYEVKAFHEDAGHLASSSKAAAIKVR